jgi:hypothetical protein
MGLIRKTLSISTLGLVSWRSKKERLREAEEELDTARALLERTSKKQSLLENRLDEAEQRAKEAELTALRDARVARRKGAWEARGEGGLLNSLLGTVRDTGRSLTEQTKATGARLAADLEPTMESTRNRGKDAGLIARERAEELRADGKKTAKKKAKLLRKRSKKARKRAAAKGADTRERLAAAAGTASAGARAKAEQLAKR